MTDDGSRGGVRIRPLGPADAEALVGCFERCYGRSYVEPAFYDPAEIRARLVDRRLRSVGAVDAAGDVVAHMALVPCHPDALTVEAGHTVVDPRHRDRQLAGRVAVRLAQMCLEAGLVAFHHYPTTAHRIMQRMATSGTGVETGIMLRYIPGDTDYGDLSDAPRERRWAATVVFQPLAAAPAREVYLPERYVAVLAPLYARADLDRRRLRAPRWRAPGSTHLGVDRNRARRLLRIRVASLGSDLAECIERLGNEGMADLVQLDLPLTDPGVSVAVEEVRRAGFFYSALLPEYGPGDVLRLQKLPAGSGVLESLDLLTDEARSLMDVIRADHADATRLG